MSDFFGEGNGVFKPRKNNQESNTAVYTKSQLMTGNRILVAGFRWIVIDINQDQKLAKLLTEDIICERSYHERGSGTCWSLCSLRHWLNGEFFNQYFSTEERSKVQKVQIENYGNEDFGTEGGPDTMDFIFLLSKSECESINRYRKINKYWWLRTPGYFQGQAMHVLTNESHIDRYSYTEVENLCGVRPCMYYHYNNTDQAI